MSDKPAGEVAACKVCNDTGWNHGAQPGPGPGYKSIHCTFCDYWKETPATIKESLTVQHSDYAAIQAERDALRAEVERLTREYHQMLQTIQWQDNDLRTLRSQLLEKRS